jgi:hypothetical protein
MHAKRSMKSKITTGFVVLMVTLMVLWLLIIANLLPHLNSVAWNDPLM